MATGWVERMEVVVLLMTFGRDGRRKGKFVELKWALFLSTEYMPYRIFIQLLCLVRKEWLDVAVRSTAAICKCSGLVLKSVYKGTKNNSIFVLWPGESVPPVLR